MFRIWGETGINSRPATRFRLISTAESTFRVALKRTAGFIAIKVKKAPAA
jgi:hypothetical protein